MKAVNISLRKCIACGSRQNKSNFIMIVRSPKSKFEKTFKLMDGTEKKDGRAAYICKKADCMKNAIRYRKIEKSFKEKINKEIYDNLKKAELNYE